MKMCLPLHRQNVKERVKLLKVAKVRQKTASRLRDKWVLQWIRARLAIYKEVKRLEQIAREEAEKERLQQLERQRQRDEAKRLK